MYIKCRNCGVVFASQFCPNCGMPAATPVSSPFKPRNRPNFLPVIVVILFIGLAFAIINVVGKNINTNGLGPGAGRYEISKTQTEFQIVTGTTATEEAFVLGILKDCGINDVDTIEHDEILDDMNEDGETGYRIKMDDLNIILYLHADKTVNMVRYADNNLYADGEVKSLISDYVLTWQEESDLQIKCQKIIKDILKSPSTAKFPSITKWSIWKQDGKIYIQSYVDAQNSFGAELRSEFQFMLSADDYTIESLIFNGEEMISE